MTREVRHFEFDPATGQSLEVWLNTLRSQGWRPVHGTRTLVRSATGTRLVLGAALAGARKARHLNQTELAKLSGVTQADISRIERGQLAPTTPTLLKLVEALHGRLTLIVPTPGHEPAAADPAHAEQLVALSVV